MICLFVGLLVNSDMSLSQLVETIDEPVDEKEEEPEA